MMIHAYQEIYLSKAQAVLGETFDYAKNVCCINGSDFIRMFSVSMISRQLENGDPAVITGRSGIELAIDIISEAKKTTVNIEPHESYDRSIEYWIGWAVCYYQWASGRSYHEIFETVSYDELEKMYYTLHEADISKFAAVMDSKMKERFPDTNLKRLRVLYGISQAQLSKRSGVGIRSIQMYEQRNKDINKASADTIYNLATVLGCSMESLLEKSAMY